jgi:GrpB-like predicted nucleotidyltransferase (UPF0157 family)
MLGLRYGTVRLEPYNPEWVGAFAEERRRLLEALSGTSCQVEHVSSRAVPELCAKPILDIAIGIAVGTPIEPIVSALRGIMWRVKLAFPTRELLAVHRVRPSWMTISLQCAT